MNKAALVPVASSAIPSALVQSGINGIVRVSLWAVRLSGVLCRMVEAPKNVHVVGDRLQMVGIYAVAHTTQMIKFKLLRNRTDKKLVGKAMGGHHVSVDLEASVTTSILSFGPEPTGGEVRTIIRDGAALVDLRPKPLLRRSQYTRGTQCSERVTMALPALVVHRAPPVRFVQTFASRDRTCRLWSHREFTPHGVIGPDVCASRPSSILPQMGQEVQF